MNNSLYKLFFCCCVGLFFQITGLQAQMGADVNTATILCDKSTITIQEMNGCGNDCREAPNTCLDDGNGGNIETNTVWFTWIANNDDDLTFVITPLNNTDQIGFTLFELTTLNDGTNKTNRRCMPACKTGSIGLNSTDFDFMEDAACPNTNNGFLSALSMEEGFFYGLMIENPNSTGGFTIEFGGSGEFLGPQAIVTPDATETCFGQTITFSNNSIFSAGNITSYEWIFGEDATPRQLSTNAPDAQTVSYSTPGAKTVELILTTDLGCSSSTTFENIITINDCCDSDNQITIDTSITEIACPNDSNGVIDLTLMSAFPTTVEWSTGEMTEDLENLFPGTYSVTVTNEASCRDSLSYTFVVPSTLEAVDEITNPSCGGVADGSITINATGGRTPYQYDFGDGFVSNNTLGNLAAGDYQVIVMDASGCTFLVDGIELAENELIITIENQGNPNCQNGFDGFVEISIMSGVGPYEYDLNDGNGRVEESVLRALSARNYVIDVYDANQCQGTFEVSLDNPDELRIIVESGRVMCNGENNGNAIAIPSGGTPDYTYQWSNGATTRAITDLAPGDYTVIVTDANGCTIERTTSISEPDPLVAEIQSIQDVECPGQGGGAIELAVLGGTIPYEYSIDGINFQAGTSISGLESGEYVITIRDDNECVIFLDATISSPENLMINASVSSNICYGEAVSYTDISTFSRGDIIDWQWNFGDGASPATATGVGPHEVTYTTVGQPIVELTLSTDLNCTVTFRDTLGFAIEPCCETLNGVALFGFGEDPLCAGDANGSIDLDISSVPAVTSISWDNGETTEDIENLTPGEYTVTVLNDASCGASFTFPIEEPTAINAMFDNIVMPSCGGNADGSISVSVGTGSGVGYEYDFGDGFTDANFNNNLAVGDYTITVRDDNNCMTTLDTALSELILAEGLVVTKEPSCFGMNDGIIENNLLSGQAPYQYDFQDGNNFQDETALTDLPAGIYMIQVQDANQCLSPVQQVFVNEPMILAITTNPTNISCFGEGDGSIAVEVTGGVGNYSYTWSDGQTGSTATNLEAGDYTLNVLDGNDCPIEGNVTITEPIELTAALGSVQNVLCFGETNGAINVDADGGSNPYSYSIDGVLFQPSPSLDGLTAGDYTVTVRDDRGCEVETPTATIGEPGEFTVTAMIDNEVSNLGFPINLNATTNVGDAGINFVWSTPDSVVCNNCPSFETIPPGSTTYTVVAVNSENCSATASVSVGVSLDRPVYIPNAFSPNGDGLNDEFFIPFTPAMTGIEELQVFDRWGSLVFENFNILEGEEISRGWDGEYNGTKLRYGVYIVVAKIRFVDNVLKIYQSDLTVFGEE